MRRTFGLWLAFVFVVIAVLPVALSAHLKLTKSSPTEGATVSTPPKQLQLWFSEEPLLPLSSVTLTGPNGSVNIDKPRASVERSLTVAIGSALPAGSYRIAWKAAGDDGHVVAGTVDFAVKESARPPM
ncbi:MAG: copper resistance CopC family protein [Vicinamibacterales bacterium]